MRDRGAELRHHYCQKLIRTLHTIKVEKRRNIEMERSTVPVQDALPMCERQGFQIVEALVVAERRLSTYLTRRVSQALCECPVEARLDT